MKVVGVEPWLPGLLARSSWWSAPVAAERLAALRIGIAAALLLDLAVGILPHFRDFFGPGSLGAQGVFGPAPGSAQWSLLWDVGDAQCLWAAVIVWLLAATGLLVGFYSRACALVAWALALSFQRINPMVHNAGDGVRIITLFMLVLCPCGAAWSVDAWRAQRGRVLVYPWAIRLLFVQMTIIYFLNGLTKWFGADWRDGVAMHYVMGDLTLMRWSPAWLFPPTWVVRQLSWGAIIWETAFPLLVLRPKPRQAALILGATFHLTTLIFMDLGAFPINMLCLYLPLLPWERLRRSAETSP